MSGAIDVAFTQSGNLEATHPEMLPYLRIIHQINASFQNEPYPFKTSTQITPTFSLMAGPAVPWNLRLRVTEALSAINASHPAAAAAQISHFTVPASYAISRQSALRLGIMRDRGATYDCPDQFVGTYELLNCPDGYIKPSRDDIETRCAAMNVSCPEGLECFCTPCILDDDLAIFIESRSVNGSTVLDAPCQKMEEVAVDSPIATCLTVHQNEPVQLRIRNIRSRNVTVQFHLSVPVVLACLPLGDKSMECAVNMTIGAKGLILVEVLADGIQAPTSPVFINVFDRSCGNGTEALGFALRQADESGQCVCPPSTFEISSRCTSSAMILAVTIVPTVLAAVLALTLYVKRRIDQKESAWKIQSRELVFDDPPEVLGRGTFGLVLKATFRNTPVAVKKVLPPLSNRRGSTSTPNSSCSMNSMSNMDMMESMEPGRTTSTGSNISRPSSILSAGSVMNSAGMAIKGSFDRRDFNLRLRARMKQDFLAEIRLLAHLRHPNIIPLMGAVVDKEEPLLVMELMNLGSLWDLLRNETVEMDGSMALQVLQGIVQGMSFLHASKPTVIHGDLKSSNVLVNDKFQARLSDFGLSQKRRMARGVVGTPYWTGPEILNGGPLEPHSDVYSFAITVWEVMSRSDPYPGEAEAQVLRSVRDGTKRPAMPRGCGAKIVELITDCWSQEPSFRPTFAQIEKRMLLIPTSEVRSDAWSRGFGVDREQSSASWERCFPPDTTDAVARGQKVAPIRKPMVSVFFSSVDDFSTISSSMDASKVSDLLNRLYTRFDTIADSMGIFKIETIGDTYLCATNLCDDQEDTHVATLARFAVAAVQAAGETLIDLEAPQLGGVSIKVGICSGPVTGCLIGTNNVKFTLLGDTVNVASRMQSTSSPGYIQCAEISGTLIKAQDPSIPLFTRGTVEVKGKGRMMTFWVDKAPLPPEYSLKLSLPRSCSQKPSSLPRSGRARSGGVTFFDVGVKHSTEPDCAPAHVTLAGASRTDSSDWLDPRDDAPCKSPGD